LSNYLGFESESEWWWWWWWWIVAVAFFKREKGL